MNQPFSVAFVRSTAFGTLAAVHLPGGVEAVTNDVLARLHPDERALAQAMRGRRQIEFTGGRLAFRALRPSSQGLGTGARGEPLCPRGLSVSVTHKRDLALAVVGDAGLGTLGLDLEGDGRARMTIAERVLRPEELDEVLRLGEAERWPAVLLRFALKEAAYKAIHPHLLRFVGFQEAKVAVAGAQVTLSIVGEPGLVLEGAWEALGDSSVLASVRALKR